MKGERSGEALRIPRRPSPSLSRRRPDPRDPTGRNTIQKPFGVLESADERVDGRLQKRKVEPGFADDDVSTVAESVADGRAEEKIVVLSKDKKVQRITQPFHVDPETGDRYWGDDGESAPFYNLKSDKNFGKFEER